MVWSKPKNFVFIDINVIREAQRIVAQVKAMTVNTFFRILIQIISYCIVQKWQSIIL